MGNRSLRELEKEGKRTLKELEESAREEAEKTSRQLVEKIAKKEGVVFDELWGMFESRDKYRGYLGSHQIRFSISEYAPIEYWRDMETWFVYIAIPNCYVKARNLGEALVLAKRAYEKQPWVYDRVIIS